MIEVLSAVLASVAWSFVPAIISRWGKDVSPSLFTAIRAFSALIILLMILKPLRYVLKVDLFIGNLDVPIIVLLFVSGVIGPGIGDITYTKAIQILGGSLAITISYTYILLVQFFALILHVEIITIGVLIGGMISFLGVCVAVVGRPTKINFVGIVYALTASICWALAITIVRILQPYIDVLTLTVLRIASAAIATTAIGFTKKERFNLSCRLFISAFAAGIIGWCIGMVLYMFSIYAIGASKASIATSLTPILSQLTSRYIAHERQSFRVVVGSLLVAIGIAISNVL